MSSRSFRRRNNRRSKGPTPGGPPGRAARRAAGGAGARREPEGDGDSQKTFPAAGGQPDPGRDEPGPRPESVPSGRRERAQGGRRQEQGRGGRRPESAPSGRRERQGKGGASRVPEPQPARPEIPMVFPDCPVCGKPVRELASALTHRASRQPAHFDCVFRELRDVNGISPQEKLCYLGSGSFGILEFKAPVDRASSLSASASSTRRRKLRRSGRSRSRSHADHPSFPLCSAQRSFLGMPLAGHVAPARAPGAEGGGADVSLKFALLGLLAESPKYGYEIKRRFEGALGNVWSVSYGQLYPTLRRLSELGWSPRRPSRARRRRRRTSTRSPRRGAKSSMMAPETPAQHLQGEGRVHAAIPLLQQAGP